ncbi:SRPBCC family protein [Intrasporangium calvum]|uniref:SRPBCC family protein n=1 Tax=Intrasporangium calvum TaxID=53358 RepID=UPI0018FF3F45|nr:SRPBCC family protein [Intrasporangium calvum]
MQRARTRTGHHGRGRPGPLALRASVTVNRPPDEVYAFWRDFTNLPRISWRSLPGADIDNSGTVHFAPAPGDRGTEVSVALHYDLPGGKLGQAVATLFGEEPEQQVRHDLRRFKQVLETGDVVRSGRAARRARGAQHRLPASCAAGSRRRERERKRVPSNVTSSRATWSPCGEPGRSVSSRRSARPCSERPRSSSSTASPSAWRWPSSPPARTR